MQQLNDCPASDNNGQLGNKNTECDINKIHSSAHTEAEQSLYSVECEQGIIGSLLVDNKLWSEIVGFKLVPHDFTTPEHQRIFKEIQKFVDKGECYEMVTIAERLKGKVGEDYIFGVGTGHWALKGIREYAKIVRDKSTCRMLISQAELLRSKPENLPFVLCSLQSLSDNYAQTTTRQLKVISAAELLIMNCKPQEFILTPIIVTQGLVMVIAFRGIGKTYVALGIAFAVATGSDFLTWKAEKARAVLFIDGEMPLPALQERLAQIVKATDKETNLLFFLTPDLQEYGIPDLSTKEGQTQIEAIITKIEKEQSLKIELIILDNVSCLVRSGKENEAESWQPTQSWILKMRSQGCSLVLIQHAGKDNNKGARGSSKKEDVLDTIISLSRPKGYLASEGARFIVEYTKARYLHGDDVKSFEAMLVTDKNGNQVWTTKDIDQSMYEKVVSLANDGITQKDIAEELGINKSTVSRNLKQARAQGELRGQNS
jgi:hypothetical protein